MNRDQNRDQYMDAHERLAGAIIEAYDTGCETGDHAGPRCAGVIEEALKRADAPGMVVVLALAMIEDRVSGGDS